MRSLLLILPCRRFEVLRHVLRLRLIEAQRRRMSDGMGVRGISQIFLPLFARAVSGAINIRSDGGDAMPVRAVARRATAHINDPRPLRHEFFSADLLVTPID